MSEDYTIGIVAWINHDAGKGMCLDSDGQVYPFDNRNLAEGIVPDSLCDSHIVAMHLDWRNSRALLRTLYWPTREEVRENETVLRDVFEKNALRQALIKAERR